MFVTHLAQLVEHGSYEPRVVGSSPTLSKNYFYTAKITKNYNIKEVVSNSNNSRPIGGVV